MQSYNLGTKVRNSTYSLEIRKVEACFGMRVATSPAGCLFNPGFGVSLRTLMDFCLGDLVIDFFHEHAIFIFPSGSAWAL